MRNALTLSLVALTLVVLSAPGTLAGPYGDDLSKCLVASATERDRTDLVRWIFAASSAHPDVRDLVTVTGAQRTAMSRTVGALFERLLTESCRSQFHDASKYEGDQALVMSFSLLGQVAMRGLMEHSEVSKVMGELDTFVSKDKINAVIRPGGP